jgi:phosphate transport system protein
MPLHTDLSFEAELARLRERILYMGAKVEAMVAAGVRAFDTRDGALASRTVAQDHEVNRLEVEIDGLCLSILARRQPVASDLRFLATALKLVTDLERIGDLAVNICERVIGLEAGPADRPGAPAYPEVLELAQTVQGMVRDALDAFVAGDAAGALRVIEGDRGVDASYVQLFHRILLDMMEGRTSVQRGTGVQGLAKHLERIGDHVTNLAELVVFMTQGTDIRHPYSQPPGPETPGTGASGGN